MPQGQAAKKQTKHAEITESINKTRLAAEGLRNLLIEVTGEEAPPDKADTERSGTLLNFLNGAGSEIDSITDDLNRTRDELQAALF